jgi:flagellar protein FlaG
MSFDSIKPIGTASGMNETYYNRGGSSSENIVAQTKDISHVLSSIRSSKAIELAEVQGHHISISDEHLIKAIEKAVKTVQGPHTFLEFSVHEKTKRISVKVHDQATGEVIREIPPEKTLDFVAKLWEMAGILVDERR